MNADNPHPSALEYADDIAAFAKARYGLTEQEQEHLAVRLRKLVTTVWGLAYVAGQRAELDHVSEVISR